MNRILVVFIFMVSLSCETQKLPPPLVIAHRGLPYFAPEETAPAFVLARDLGADYLEADLQRTKDGVIIALHDNSLVRTTNIREVFPARASDPISSFTWGELQQLDAGSWFNEKYPDRAKAAYKGLKILSLEQLLDLASIGNNQPGLYLETKTPEQFPGIEADLRKLLESKGWYKKKLPNGQPAVILQSFSTQSIELLRQEFPEAPICYLLWPGEGCLKELNEESLAQCLDFADKMTVDFIGVSFPGEKTGYSNQLVPWFIEAVKAKGMQIHAFTFDTMGDIEKFAPLVAGQFTNRADLSLDFYRRPHPLVANLIEEHKF